MSATFRIRNAKCIKETEKALLIEAEKLEDSPQWIPQSQIDDDSEVYQEGDEGVVVVSEWFAIQRGWLED